MSPQAREFPFYFLFIGFRPTIPFLPSLSYILLLHLSLSLLLIRYFCSLFSPSDSESRAPVLVESMGEGALDCVLTLFIFGFVFLELANSPTRYPQRVGGFVMSLWRYAERRKVSTN